MDDEMKEKLMQIETTRIIKESQEGLTEAERMLFRMLVTRIVDLSQPFPTKVACRALDACLQFSLMLEEGARK